jgi:hypothetical protein
MTVTSVTMKNVRPHGGSAWWNSHYQRADPLEAA